jgi:NitT/TauT family transport system permease protein
MKSNRFDWVMLLIGLLGLWQLLHWAVGANVLSAPLATLVRALELLQSGVFRVHIASTLSSFAMASAIGIVGGVVLGLWLGLRRFAGDVADPILNTFYSIPKITLYPLILLIFGLGMPAKVAFGVLHGIFPITIFTMNAVRNVAPIHQRTAHILRLSPVATAATIMMPASLPEILAGVRIGAALTLLGVLIGELFASTSGLGFALVRAMDVHAVTDIMAITLLLFAFAALLNAMLQRAERWVRHNG